MNESIDTAATPGGFTPEPAKARTDRKGRTYSRREFALSWASAFLGYLFCRTFWVWKKPAVGMIFSVCLYAFAFVFFHGQKRRARSLFYPVSALILSTALFFSSSPVLLFFTFAYICFSFLMYCQTGSQSALEIRAGSLYVFETVKAHVVSPFRNIGAAVGAVSSDKGGKKIGKSFIFILAGTGAAIIPTLIVLRLLSFDAGFTGILDNIKKTVFDRLFSHLLSVAFGVPIGLFIFSAAYTSAHPAADAYNAENCEKIENRLKFAPGLVGVIFVVPLLFLYVVFIAAQKDYYAAIFNGAPPAAYSFSEFARDGFFRLCAVAAINAIVLIVLRVFTQKTGGGKISPAVKIPTVVLSLVTVIISATAISQMMMYVSAYGLTRLRLYTLWFMGLLILFFIAAIIKQFAEKMPFAPVALLLFVVCFGLIAVPDTDAFIARHNYDCWLSGSTTELDVGYLGQIYPSSGPVLCEIAEDVNVPQNLRDYAKRELRAHASKSETTFSLPQILADRAYKRITNPERNE